MFWQCCRQQQRLYLFISTFCWLTDLYLERISSQELHIPNGCTWGLSRLLFFLLIWWWRLVMHLRQHRHTPGSLESRSEIPFCIALCVVVSALNNFLGFENLKRLKSPWCLYTLKHTCCVSSLRIIRSFSKIHVFENVHSRSKNVITWVCIKR